MTSLAHAPTSPSQPSARTTATPTTATPTTATPATATQDTEIADASTNVGSAGSTSRDTGAVTGAVRVLLRLEALAAFAAALVAYHHSGGAWSTFAWLFLLPDLAFLGYLAGPRVGAVAYDATHTWLGPAALALLGALAGLDVLWLVAIWSAHLGFDRALGYGLKYSTSFPDTHLGALGRHTSRTEAKSREERRR